MGFQPILLPPPEENIMVKKLTIKQENFVRYLMEGMNQREAYVKAGYAFKSSLAVMDSNASRLASSEKVAIQLTKLRKRAEDASVSSVLERKQILTEIERADLSDFVDSDGETIRFGKDLPNHRAVAEFSITTTYTKKGEPVVTKSIKLRNSIGAIQEHNKMERVYDDSPKINVNIDQRQLNVYDLSTLSDQELDILEQITRKATPIGTNTTGGDISRTETP
jgi:hypothetical protein